MFTKNILSGSGPGAAPRGRGRPPGRTRQGAAARERLFRIAIREIARRGYEAATLREIAAKAGVSVGLLYRYFPSKQAVVLALYEELSAAYAQRAHSMSSGSWRDRFLFALRASLTTLGPRHDTLAALVPVLVGDREEGLFSPRTAFSRQRVQHVFVTAVTGAGDAPPGATAESLGRLLYLAHLAILLWWLLDRSRDQRATAALVSLVERALPLVALALRMPIAATLIGTADALVLEGLFGEGAESEATR